MINSRLSAPAALRRGHQLVQVLAEDVLAPDGEHLKSGVVELDRGSVGGHCEDRVVCRVEHGGAPIGLRPVALSDSRSRACVSASPSAVETSAAKRSSSCSVPGGKPPGLRRHRSDCASQLAADVNGHGDGAGNPVRRGEAQRTHRQARRRRRSVRSPGCARRSRTRSRRRARAPPGRGSAPRGRGSSFARDRSASPQRRWCRANSPRGTRRASARACLLAPPRPWITR
jgi:hypothetical protein